MMLCRRPVTYKIPQAYARYVTLGNIMQRTLALSHHVLIYVKCDITWPDGVLFGSLLPSCCSAGLKSNTAMSKLPQAVVDTRVFES